ncbi:hypothetical protein TWF788_001078 [Orbilia oligospora]|uniref:Uncharacterized protein n=1 Tax=Orbilia oligospora TaxID=2813651 RepID=A0A7C8PFR3_ORBOL|nr:hypothetical protein TWF788_001078 [Orbilia oligospora]
MQLIHLFSILTVLGGALSAPAPSLDDHKPTPAKRDPKFPLVNIVYETTAPTQKPRPEPRPIYGKPRPEPRPIHFRPIVHPDPINRVAWPVLKPRPRPTPTKPYGWRGNDKLIGGRSAAAVDPDKPVHILPFPQYTGPPVTEHPEDPEEQPEPVPKPKPTTTTTKTTTTSTSKPTATPVKKHKSWKWPAKVRPPYYRPWYGVGDNYEGPRE